jgi:hypothetical protein
MAARRGEWFRVSNGLRLVAHAIVLQLIMVVVAFLMILLLASSKKGDGLEMFAMVAAVIGLIAQVIMVTGIVKFSNQPPPRPSAGLAQAAGAFGCIGLAISAYALFVMVRVIAIGSDPSPEDVQWAMEAAERLPKLEVAAVVVGFLAMVFLLVAVRSLAVHLESLAVERKARIAIAMVVLATAVFAFMRLAFTPEGPGSLAAALVLVTIVEVAAFVNVLGTVRGLDGALRSPVRPELEVVRV